MKTPASAPRRARRSRSGARARESPRRARGLPGGTARARGASWRGTGCVPRRIPRGGNPPRRRFAKGPSLKTRTRARRRRRRRPRRRRPPRRRLPRTPPRQAGFADLDETVSVSPSACLSPSARPTRDRRRGFRHSRGKKKSPFFPSRRGGFASRRASRRREARRGETVPSPRPFRSRRRARPRARAPSEASRDAWFLLLLLLLLLQTDPREDPTTRAPAA